MNANHDPDPTPLQVHDRHVREVADQFAPLLIEVQPVDTPVIEIPDINEFGIRLSDNTKELMRRTLAHSVGLGKEVTVSEPVEEHVTAVPVQTTIFTRDDPYADLGGGRHTHDETGELPIPTSSLSSKQKNSNARRVVAAHRRDVPRQRAPR